MLVKKPRFWLQDGKWRCAVPRGGPVGFPQTDWWKRYGLIGCGNTREEALKDFKEWQRAAEFVASIY